MAEISRHITRNVLRELIYKKLKLRKWKAKKNMHIYFKYINYILAVILSKPEIKEKTQHERMTSDKMILKRFC